MTRVIAIIDGNYGDSGKGLMTDYYSSRYDDAVVVRSNGGANAGHSVQTPAGQRHVFSHFGSGSLNGTPTFLSRHFVCNPILFKKEHELFVKDFGIIPKIYVAGGCLVSTPYEMLLNQTHESMRGCDVHGSCGVGFGETLERALIHDSLYMIDIDFFLEHTQIDEFTDSLLDIRNNYVPSRIDLSKVSEDFIKILNSDELIADFIDACRYMLEHVQIGRVQQFEENTLIFEASQGLLLDMDYGHFPYVTRSNCGMRNISNVLGDMICMEHDITVNYITRSYTTRHGAGPLNFECGLDELGYNVVDETNIPNQFQGSLRFAPLDLDLFNSVTDKDFLNYAPRGSKKMTTVTCLDQIRETCDNDVRLVDGNRTITTSAAKFKHEIVPQRFDYQSYGPTRNDVSRTNRT